MATITSAGNGNSSSTTPNAPWPGGTVPVSGDKVIIAAGTTVTLDAVHTWGDDTSSLTPANNAIRVDGTLKYSRVSNASLTCRGTLFVNTGGTLDIGVTGSDPIPAGVTATLIVNDSASLAIGKHGLVTAATTGVVWTMAGAVKTCNTTLTGATLAGATSITVAASAGWAIGDSLAVASDTDDPTRSQVITITGGAAPTWTTSAITNARASGTRIGNLSSNVTVKSMAAATPGFVSYNVANTSTTGGFNSSDVRFENLGNAAAWAAVAAASADYVSGLTVKGSQVPLMTHARLKFVGTVSQVQRQLCVSTTSIYRHSYTDLAIHFTSDSTNAAIFTPTGTTADIDFVAYRCGLGVLSSNSDGSAGCVFSGEAWCVTQILSFNPSVLTTFSNFIGRTTGRAFGYNNGRVIWNGGTINAATSLGTVGNSPGVSPDITVNNATISAAALAGSLTSGTIPSQSGVIKLVAVNGTASDNRVLSYYLWSTTDLATKKNGSYSVKMLPQVANTNLTYTFTIPVIAGQTYTVKGNLRFDATYGVGNPPSIVLSGQGVAGTFTATATANAWWPFTFTFTPTGTGDVTATVTVRSASTAGFAWLDGVYHYPMIQTTRWYGYLYGTTAALTVDPVVTLSEAAAAALTGISYAGGALTVSGTLSIHDVYDWLKWYETTNQVAAIITSTDGVAFTLGANLTLTGAITGSGTLSMATHTLTASGSSTVPITHSTGVYVPIRVSNILLGSRVQVFNENVSSGELFNDAITTGAGAVLVNTNWTSDVTIRVRATALGYLPQLATGLLTSSGLSVALDQVIDSVYDTNGIDGSTVTEFTADFPNVQVDINDPDGVTTVQRLYAWLQYTQTSANGIRDFFDAIDAFDTLNYTIDSDVVNLKLDNVGASAVLIEGGNLTRSDNTTVIGAGSIQMDPGKAYSSNDITTDVSAILTAVTPLPAEVSAILTAVTPLPADVTSILTLVQALPTDVATIVALLQALPSAAAAADALLGRNLAGGSNGGRTVRDALRASRNRTTIQSGALTVYTEDDTTVAWEAVVTTEARDALAAIDPT